MIQYLSHGKTAVRKPSPWKFAYIGGTGNTRCREERPTLKELPIGDRALVSGYGGSEGIGDFQRSGLSVGAEIRILSRKPSGSVVIQLGELQIGLGSSIVDRILVKPL